MVALRITVPYLVRSTQQGSIWVAHAEREDTGRRFGIEVQATTEAEAVERLTRWLAWQAEHTAALEALQQAERIHLRTITDSAFSGAQADETVVGLQRESLNEVDEARRTLDVVRARRPE